MRQEAPKTCTFYRDRLIPRIDMTVPGDVRRIDPVVGSILETTREMGCSEEHEFEVETAIREALANAIVHGCKNDPTRKCRITVGCDEDRGMLIVVQDPGAGFDPDSIPSPIEGEHLFSEHGRGIFLINRLMDDVEFRRGGTEIRMRKGHGG